MSDRYLIQLASIRSLNDDLRTRMSGGVISVGDDVKGLGTIVHVHALLEMAEHDCFEDDEHGHGRFFFCARVFHWWIDYGGSPDPANAALTKRTLFLSL